MSASRQYWAKDASTSDAEEDHAFVPPPAHISFDSPAALASATHEASFAANASATACDVCGEPVPDDDDTGPALTGRALYVWTRGEESRHEEAPLCASCAAALGLTALARWEIDEEEG